MAQKHSFIAMVQVETDDPRLSVAAMAQLATAADAAAIRRLVLSRLPHDVTRLIAVLPPDKAQQLLRLYEAVGKDSGAPAFVRPPADDVPPT